jgi:hypothetical protein
MNEKLIADLISELYSKLDKDSEYACGVLGKMRVCGLDPDLLLDEHDDIISDANEYRKARDTQLAEYDRCLECGTTLGHGTCEACRQDREERQVERDIDEARGK